MIFTVIFWAFIVVAAMSALIHVGFETDWLLSILIAAVIVMACLDCWLLWHLQFNPAISKA